MTASRCAVRLAVPAGAMAPFLGSGPLMRPPAARMAVTPRRRGAVPEAVGCDQGGGEEGAGRRVDAAGNHATCVMASHADRREARSQQAARPMAQELPRPADRRPAARRAPGRKQKEKTMIFHINLFTLKPGASQEQRDTGPELMRQVGANPVVKSLVVGPEFGGEFESGAVYVVEDLDGYWAYLEYPAHVHLELWGIPYLEKFAAIDVTDSGDPEFGAKVAALQARHQQDHPEIAAEIAQAASFTVPDGAGQPSV